MSTPVFQVAVRHRNGSSNLFHVQGDEIRTHEDAITLVRRETLGARAVLACVLPAASSPMEVTA